MTTPDSAASPGAAPTEPGLDTPSLSPEQMRGLRIWGSVVAVLSVGGWAGLLGFARLANDLPLLLVALSPLGRHLVLVAPAVDPFAFVAVATSRLLLSCLVGHRLAQSLGEPGLRWLDGNAPSAGRMVRYVERLFARSAPLAILIWPGFLMGVLSGVAGMHLARLLALSAVGILLRLGVILWLGHLLAEPLAWLRAWIGQNWIAVTIVVVVGIVGYRRLRPAAPPTPLGRGPSV